VLIAVVGAGRAPACAGGIAAFDEGTDAVPVTGDSADGDCAVVLSAASEGTVRGDVGVAPVVSSAPEWGLRGFPPKTVTVTATVITTSAVAATAAAVRIGRERIPGLA
jgi:hypothetical protein